MNALLGTIFLNCGLGAVAVGLVLSLAAGTRRGTAALRLTRWMTWISALCLGMAILVMETALLQPDFSVSYVAEVGSRATPPLIALTSLWSSLDGSMLFWAFLMSIYTAVFAFQTRGTDNILAGRALFVLLAVCLFFFMLVLGIAAPFKLISPIPPDGPGPNPLLQNHWLMAVHPPTLYLGYVGMAVPFAMAVAALEKGVLDAAWMRAMRAWALFVWAFLTLGILMGGWWSYEVLGWGGYWAWDPVENASLLPWLTLTAFIHSLIITDRRGQMPGWTMVLAMVSFLLTLLGTFMTRSGVFNSVHSFTQSAIGPIFLGFIAVVFIGSVLLLASRIDKLRAGVARGLEPISRESSFLVNNLLFCVFSFTVLVGTLYPLLNQAITGQQISVGEPYYNTMSVPAAAAIVFLMGVGPALPWGAVSSGAALRQLAAPMVGGVLGVVLALIWGGAPWVVITWAFSGFAAVVSFRELWLPVQSRMKSKGEGIFRAAWRSLSRMNRRVGAHVSHLGVVVVAVAIAASGNHKQEGALTLEVGIPQEWAGYSITYMGAETIPQEFRTTQTARFQVSRGGGNLGVVSASMNQYKTMNQPLGSPGVLSQARSDFYVSIVQIDRATDSVDIRVFEEPLVVWLWIGGLVVVLGGLIAILPRRSGRSMKTAEVTP